jgi:glyoxylase-like metal-dependent hydrolase (beta-lactamase superfamily II)
MRLINIKTYGPVTSCELGWSIVGRPAWTVYLYMVDNICIDTGQSRMRSYVMEFLKPYNINQIVLTHHHEDHSGNAAAIKEARHVQVYGHPITVEKMRQKNTILPYQHYTWGASTPLTMLPLPEIIESDRFVFQPIHTPGHSKDHVVFFEEKNGWLFSGDLFLAERIKYFRSDERMKEQIDSLKKISAFDFKSLFCAHNPKPENGKKCISNKLQFLEDFYGNVQQLWEKGLSENEIIRSIGVKEDYLIKIFCMGNVSMKNMIRSAVKSF